MPTQTDKSVGRTRPQTKAKEHLAGDAVDFEVPGFGAAAVKPRARIIHRGNEDRTSGRVSSATCQASGLCQAQHLELKFVLAVNKVLEAMSHDSLPSDLPARPCVIKRYAETLLPVYLLLDALGTSP